jgi:hypothetical protein
MPTNASMCPLRIGKGWSQPKQHFGGRFIERGVIFVILVIFVIFVLRIRGNLGSTLSDPERNECERGHRDGRFWLSMPWRSTGDAAGRSMVRLLA